MDCTSRPLSAVWISILTKTQEEAMLDLAIPMEDEHKGNTIVETNHGDRLVAPDWPHDCEFQLVTFSPKGRRCKVVYINELSKDIAEALKMIDDLGIRGERKPEWYRNL